jgi:hypothetical protein
MQNKQPKDNILRLTKELKKLWKKDIMINNTYISNITIGRSEQEMSGNLENKHIKCA